MTMYKCMNIAEYKATPVGVSSLLHECSISLWSEYVSVLVLMLVYLQIWWGWVIALWAKIGRDIGKLFNLKLLFMQFWKKGTL